MASDGVPEVLEAVLLHIPDFICMSGIHQPEYRRLRPCADQGPDPVPYDSDRSILCNLIRCSIFPDSGRIQGIFIESEAQGFEAQGITGGLSGVSGFDR